MNLCRSYVGGEMQAGRAAREKSVVPTDGAKVARSRLLAADDPMPTPTSSDPSRYLFRNDAPEEWPVIDIELPDFLPHVREGLEESSRLTAIVDPGQGTKGAIRV